MKSLAMFQLRSRENIFRSFICDLLHLGIRSMEKPRLGFPFVYVLKPFLDNLRIQPILGPCFKVFFFLNFDTKSHKVAWAGQQSSLDRP